MRERRRRRFYQTNKFLSFHISPPVLSTVDVLSSLSAFQYRKTQIVYFVRGHVHECDHHRSLFSNEFAFLSNERKNENHIYRERDFQYPCEC